MDKEKKITKIVVKQEDELTDIVTAIINAKSERIVLTFAEETDLLISPINLRVLLETADEKEKLLVAQIIKNPTGLRNANSAGLSTIDSPQFPEEDVWETEEINRAKRLTPPKKRAPTKKTEEKEEKKADQPTDFQKRIDAAIAKNKEKNEAKELGDDDVLITLDEDLPANSSEPEITFLKEDPEQKSPSKKENSKQDNRRLQEKEPNLSKVDFSDKTKDPIKTTPEERKKLKKGEASKKIKGVFSSIGTFFTKIPIPHKIKKIAPILGISIVVLAILVGLIYLNTALLVRVRIYVEAKDVEIEKVFEGDENIKEIDFENSKIPIKTESVEKARSSTIKATGTAFRGEKATGVVNITYYKQDSCEQGETPPLELPSGQSLSTEGLTFTLDSSVSIDCNDTAEAPITAVEVGEEYNLSSGKFFTFQNYPVDQLSALNNKGAITGGSKEEYTVLSKADVDKAIEELSNIAIKEGEGDLKDLAGSWEIIPDSITSKVLPDSTKTDVAIGAEATNVNVSITTESTASYFLKEGFDDGVEELLTNKAKEENLFETDKDWDLELDKEIEKEISVVESNAQGISIKLVAKSAVKPKVDTEEILSELQDMNWEEGQEYLKSLEFSEKETRVEFYPEWFPEGLKRFPKRQGGVLITISNIN
jgi:hypothetical protein